MRKISSLKTPISGCVRCIMYSSTDGVYVFPCATEEDGSATGDYWFNSIEEAEEFCKDEYGICNTDWTEVPDPLPGCQHDWLMPVRVKEREKGSPDWRMLERLEDGNWISFSRDPLGIVNVSDIELRAWTQIALTSHITPRVRSISIDKDHSSTMLVFRVFSDTALDEFSVEALNCAVTEIQAGMGCKVKEEYIVLPEPEPMDYLRLVVYARCEDV